MQTLLQLDWPEYTQELLLKMLRCPPGSSIVRRQLLDIVIDQGLDQSQPERPRCWSNVPRDAATAVKCPSGVTTAVGATMLVNGPHASRYLSLLFD